MESATSPATNEDGYFFQRENVSFSTLDPSQTSFTDDFDYASGTYYVHLAGHDQQCVGGVCEPVEFSNILVFQTLLPVTVPPDLSGAGGGSSGGAALQRPKPVPVAADTATGFSALKAAKSQRIDKLFVLAGMGEAGTITAGGTVNVPSLSKVYKFKTASANVAAGGTVKLKLKLPTKALKAVKKALKRHKKLKANLTITARDKAGNKKSEKRTVSLRS